MTRVFLYVFFSGFAMDNPEEEAARRPSPPRSVALLVSHSRFMRRQRAVEKPTAHLQSSSALSRTARSRRLGQFLRAAEEVGALSGNFNFYPQGARALQLHAEYDASCYALPRRERAVSGPLVTAFTFYAKVLDPRVATGKYYPLFDSIDRASKTMTFTELLAFCWDFNIVPQLISRGDLRYVFGTVGRAPDDKLTELTFEQFEELLTRVALVAFYPLSDTDVRRIGMATMKKLREHINAKRIRIKDVFRKFDTSGDGILDRSELMQGLRDICGSAIKQRDLEAVYSLVDADGGGEVEFIEFVTALNEAAPAAFSKKSKVGEEERYKVPYEAKMAEWEDKDSDNEGSGKDGGDGEDDEDEYDMFGNKKEKEKKKSALPAPTPPRPYRKCLADYAQQGLVGGRQSSRKGDGRSGSLQQNRETKDFPGGRNLSPRDRINSLMRSMGQLTNAAFRKVIDTKGRLTAGKMNGSIKSNGEFDFVTSIKASKASGVGSTAQESKTKESRILRKRDGTMCDFSAPLLMERRRACTADFSPELKNMWKPLRQVDRIDDWRSYHAPCIFMGRVLVGEQHGYRVNVRNPLPFSITIEVVLRNFPDTEVSFYRQPVASGMSTPISLNTCMHRAGEHMGIMHVSWRSYQREVQARSARYDGMISDENEGTCSVPLYATVLDRSDYAAKDIINIKRNIASSAQDRHGNPSTTARSAASGRGASREFRCPAKEFEQTCEFSRCPRYSLPVEHPVHKYEVPSASGDWHSRQPYEANDGRSGCTTAWRQPPTRLKPTNTLPRMGSSRMMGRDLPTQHMTTASNASLASTVDLDDAEKAMRRGFLPHAYMERKRRQQEKMGNMSLGSGVGSSKSRSNLEPFAEED